VGDEMKNRIIMRGEIKNVAGKNTMHTLKQRRDKKGKQAILFS
jgi:hypothetical protein